MKFMDAELSILEKLLLHMMSHSGIALYDSDFHPNAVPGTNIIPTKTSTRIDFMKKLSVYEYNIMCVYSEQHVQLSRFFKKLVIFY